MSESCLWVQPEFMLLVFQAFHALKSHTDQRGFMRYATISQLMPTSTAVLPARSRSRTCVFLKQWNNYFPRTFRVFRQLLRSLRTLGRFCNSHPKHCVTGITKMTLSQITNILGLSKAGIYTNPTHINSSGRLKWGILSLEESCFW